MNVLLIQPPSYYHGKSREQAFFPIGLGYITRAVIDEGHEVHVLDLHASHILHDQIADIIKKIPFDVV
ncbi:MAG: hypothetical protein SVW57_14585, partial [Thermodesulfobacteriota bacterium]|nr:hypothetical protein [Thermodesulfobacteriota bacterium]